MSRERERHRMNILGLVFAVAITVIIGAVAGVVLLYLGAVR
jgi:hypothetical protein